MTLSSIRTLAGQNLLLAAVLLMLGGDFMFALNDALGKWLVATFSVGQVVLIRSVGAFIILGPMIARQGVGELLRPQRPWLQLLRVVMATTDTVLFYAAVVYLPLADVMTLYMAGPIYVAAISHMFLGEKVGWRRWLAILAGFVGVLIALRPSSAALSLASIYALVGSLSFAIATVLNRSLRGTRDGTLVTWQTVGALVGGMALSVGNWQPAGAMDLFAMLLLGVISCIAHLMITRALKMAPASTLAPLHYSLLIWGVAFGLMFFSDVPDSQILLGSAVIVLAGLFIFHRQKVVDKGVPPESIPRDMP
jgi:S-adenosylmethionine uptake transporter